MNCPVRRTTDEQFRQLFARLPDLAARNEIWERSEPIVRGYYSRHGSREGRNENSARGLLLVSKYIDEYDLTKGRKWACYLYQRLRWQYMRDCYYSRREGDMRALWRGEGAAEHSEFRTIDNRDQLEWLMGTLTELERAVVRQNYGLDGDSKPDHVIAIQLGVTRSRVQQIRAAALAKMQRVAEACND